MTRRRIVNLKPVASGAIPMAQSSQFDEDNIIPRDEAIMD